MVVCFAGIISLVNAVMHGFERTALTLDHKRIQDEDMKMNGRERFKSIMNMGISTGFLSGIRNR